MGSMKYYEEYKGFSNEELVILAQEGNKEARDYLVLEFLYIHLYNIDFLFF